MMPREKDIRTVLAVAPDLCWKRHTDVKVSAIGYHPDEPDTPLVLVTQKHGFVEVVVDDRSWPSTDYTLGAIVRQIASITGVPTDSSMDRLRELARRTEGVVNDD